MGSEKGDAAVFIPEIVPVFKLQNPPGTSPYGFIDQLNSCSAI